MNIYRFVLPKKDNSGQGMALSFAQLRKLVLDKAGGYTQQPDVLGTWRGDDGVTYVDESYVLEIATDAETAEAILNEGVRPLWPDQLSFFVAIVGIAQFVPGLAALDGPVPLELPDARAA